MGCEEHCLEPIPARNTLHERRVRFFTHKPLMSWVLAKRCVFSDGDFGTVPVQMHEETGA
jgi:hypothetical protein